MWVSLQPKETYKHTYGARKLRRKTLKMGNLAVATSHDEITMAVTTIASSTISKPDTIDGELVLRICGSARDGQVVRLQSRKCTIGSGPRCTLRLRASGIQPLHCLIVRGAKSTIVRRWAADTRLNGRSFSTAPLVPGDRLGIGPIEFEVLAPAVATEPRELITNTTGLSAAASASTSDCERDHGREGGRRREIEETTARLRSAQRHGRKRARRLIEQLRADRQQIVQLQQQCERQGTEQSEIDLQLDAMSKQLDQRQTELDKRQQDLKQEYERWTNEQTEAERKLSQRQEELDQRQAELDNRKSTLQQKHEQEDGEQSEEDKRLDEKSKQLDELQAELDDRDPADEQKELCFEESSTKSPASSEEVFQNLGLSPLFSEEDGQSHDPQPAPPESALARFNSPSPPEPKPDSDDDENDGESIDDYMGRLLERVRQTTGDERQSTTSVPYKPKPVRPKPTEHAAESGDRTSPDSESEPAEPKPGKMEPRAVAPERSVDMSAMRELANFSAHTAINSHARRMLSSAALNRLSVAVTGLAAGGVSMWLWWAKASNNLPLYVAMVGFTVAAIWGVRYAALTGYLIVRKPVQPADVTGPEEDDIAQETPYEARGSD